VFHLHPATAWAAQVGAVPGGRRLEAALVARVNMRFDDTTARVDHREEWEAVYFPLGRQLDAASGRPVDYDARDFVREAPPGARFVLPDAPVGEAAFFRSAGEEIRRHLFRTRTAEVYRNRSLKLYSRIGETREAFGARCDDAAQAEADRATAKLKDRFADRIDRVGDVLRTAERRVQELETDREERSREEWLGGAGALLGTLLGGRGTTRGIAGRAARSMGALSARRSRTARTAERLETAVEKVTDKERELDELEAEMAEEIGAIDTEGSAKAGDIEAVTIPLELSDVTVDEIALVWVPKG